jgi:uncharacterized Ntn-hydrolase superfamily protein
MTYSIVARCAATGQLGVAVQSHFFAVGSVVPWVESGVGAVATQATAEVAHGPDTLSQLRDGRAPAEALAVVLRGDTQADVRQVAVVEAGGRASAHTGSACIAHASHVIGEGFSAQANMMYGPGVPEAMAAAFTAHDGSLAVRLLEALDAAESAGGDIRGRQSAALVVLDGSPSARPGHDRVVDVRVDDHPDPLAELRRLVALGAVYRAMEDADDAMAQGDLDTALAIYAESATRQPDQHELPFWHAVVLAGEGRVDDARFVAAPVFARSDGERWQELVRRLPAAGLLPADAAAQLLEPLERPPR